VSSSTGETLAVELFVKRDGPPCGKCHAAEEKLKRLGLSYVRFYIEERLLDAYEGWRDGGVVRAAAWMLADQPIPFFYFPQEREGFDYPGAMKRLKGLLKAAPSSPGNSQGDGERERSRG